MAWKPLILLWLLLSTISIEAREGDLRWLTIRDGLSGLSVLSFAEDSSGMMWMATSNGVSLFNGSTFKNFELPMTEDGLPVFCYEVVVDRHGDVWVATMNGVLRLNRYDEGFRRIGMDVSQAECLLCHDDLVYVGSRNGLYTIDRENRVHQVDIFSEGMIRGNSSVRCLREQDGEIYLTLREGVLRLNPETGKRRYYPLHTPSGLSKFDILGEKLFVGTKNSGLYVMNRQTGEWHQIEALSNIINDVHVTADGLVYVATDAEGAFVLDGGTEQVVLHYGSDERETKLPTDAVYTFVRSQRHVNWIGMFQSGVLYSPYVYPVFSPYQSGDFTTKGLKVTATLQDGHERIIAIKGGVYWVDERTGTSTFYDTKPHRVLHIMNMVRYGDAYYIGSNDGGLLKLDRSTRRLSRLPDCKQLEYCSVGGMTVSPQNQLWVASSEGLFVIDETGVLRNYTEKNSKLPLGITNISFDIHGYGWIGGSRGMCLYLPDEDDFKTTDFPAGFFNDVRRLKFIVHGDTIFAISPVKIFYTNTQMTDFGEVDIPKGVLKEKCFDYAIDEEGIHYMISEKGLFRIDTRQGRLTHMLASCGITSTTMSSATLGIDSQSVWMATSEGLLVADKGVFTRGNEDWGYCGTATDGTGTGAVGFSFDIALIGEDRLSNSELLLMNDRRELRIGWNLWSGQLVLRPVLMDYSDHNGEMMEYRIDDGAWERMVMGENIVIGSMKPGTHRVDMRLSGLLSADTTYVIKVYPTFLFYMELLFLLLALGLFFWWRNWRRKTKTILHEHEETEKALMEEMACQTAADQTAESPKYQRSARDEKELSRLFRQMDEYVKESKPYLNVDLKMSDIATSMGVSPSVLSQVFSLHVKEPYYDYINRYRLEEFKRLIAAGQHKQYTISALSEQCGFKKTSFFSTFRKVEGTTPTEYIQKQGK